ncbi:MAG: PSD1 and planctomycete cytochrome C domain-containing protein [Planctomycetota bacterium]
MSLCCLPSANRRVFRVVLATVTVCCSLSLRGPWSTDASYAQAEELAGDQRSDLRSYVRVIKHTLKERCYACHGPLKQEGGLRVDTVALMRKGGENGPAIDAASPLASRILARVADANAATRMPPEGQPLAAATIGQLREWLAAGAPAPANEQPEPDPRDHWAFKPPARPPLTEPVDTPIANRAPTTPTTPTPAMVAANPIDAFVDRELSKRHIAPRPPADKATLLRRVTLDLIGLPPTREDLHAFLADSSATAYERVVDRLLDDPRHGERWARHWMDVWRYADWHGRRHVPDVWNSAPQVWRWRDWIVDSLNQDHGYDRLVREMLAGDEVSVDNPQAAAATGYLIRNWYALNPNDWMRSNVEHVGKAFLGLTFNCAHCHDHKYDPISQDNYFQLRAFFEPISIRQDRVPGEADPGPFQEYSYGVLRKIQRLGRVQVFDKTPEAATWFYTGGDERNRVADRGSIKPALPAVLGGDRVRVEPVTLPATAWYPALRPEMLATLLNDFHVQQTANEQQLTAARKEVDAATPPLRAAVAATESELAGSDSAKASINDGGLVGRQSLVLRAGTGRRAVQQSLAKVPRLETGAAISFQLRIDEDAHVNFQLAKDLVAGLTASFVGFEAGRILAYHPGSFTEFAAGSYDWKGGQRRFAVSLRIDRAADRALLTVESLGDGRKLVADTPVALHGWDPASIAKQGFSFDARPGAVAAVDAVQVRAAPDTAGIAAVLFDCGFEPPAFEDQRDLDGREGWSVSPFSQSPGTSLISSTLVEGPRAVAQRRLAAARRALAAYELRIAALEGSGRAVDAERDSVVARVAADRVRHGLMPPGNAEELARVARGKYLTAAVRRAEADVLKHDQALAAAESKPITDAARTKEMESANKALATARDALSKATAALAQPLQGDGYPPVGPTYSPTSTGRRKALAQWITARENPLAARVAVNHVWLRHFHTPLVASVFDFGRNGARPTHPELLDWLAVELMESGWSLKRLHRLIVTSAAYRRVSSTGGWPAAAGDPENMWLWRMNTGRMEAEVVRDSLLHLSGRLDPKRGGQELENSEALTSTRRTLYYSCQPEIDGKSPFGLLFDAPEPADCYRRTRSVMPQQSLALTNSDFVQACAEKLAQRLTGHTDSGNANSAVNRGANESVLMGTERFARGAFEQVLCREPKPEELTVCLEFLRGIGGADDAVAGSKVAEARRAGLVRILMNHNDFITVR